ncbi:hypothetical protein V6Z11_D01G175500 [Gossypium hirsutum]
MHRTGVWFRGRRVNNEKRLQSWIWFAVCGYIYSSCNQGKQLGNTETSIASFNGIGIRRRDLQNSETSPQATWKHCKLHFFIWSR